MVKGTGVEPAALPAGGVTHHLMAMPTMFKSVIVNPIIALPSSRTVVTLTGVYLFFPFFRVFLQDIVQKKRQVKQEQSSGQGHTKKKINHSRGNKMFFRVIFA